MQLDFSFTAAMIVSYIFLFFLIYMSVVDTYFMLYSFKYCSVPVFFFFLICCLFAFIFLHYDTYGILVHGLKIKPELLR